MGWLNRSMEPTEPSVWVTNWFQSLPEAEADHRSVEVEYNESRPHRALGPRIANRTRQRRPRLAAIG